MTLATLFQWVSLKRDVPHSLVKMGDRGVVVDLLPPNKSQSESGYILEVFKDGETLDVISVPCSWTELLPEKWDKSNSYPNDLYDHESRSFATKEIEKGFQLFNRNGHVTEINENGEVIRVEKPEIDKEKPILELINV